MVVGGHPRIVLMVWVSPVYVDTQTHGVVRVDIQGLGLDISGVRGHSDTRGGEGRERSLDCP